MIQFLLATLTALGLSDAQQAFDNGNYAQAIELYRQHIAQQSSYEAMYGLARSLAFDGKLAEALEAYNQLLQAYPNDPDGLLGRGRVYAWLKQFVAAEADLLQVLQLKADYGDAWQALADVYYWSQKSEQAEFFSRWQTQLPQQAAPYLAEARYLMSLRRFPQAREAVLKARQLGAIGAESDRLLSQINRQPGMLNWESLVLYDFQAFSQREQPWHTLTAGIGKHFDGGFVSLQGSGVQRFGLWDQSLGLDSYFDLWPGGYGNFRASATWDPEVIPKWDIFGEVYQSLFDIFELSGGYRLMAFKTSDVHFFHIGLGTYLGNWYVGLQPMFLTGGEGPGAQLSGWARYVFNTADDYVDLRLGVGRRIATVGPGPELAGQTSVFAVLGGQYFITPQVGILANLNYNYDDQFPARFGFTIGNKLRW